MRAKKVYTIPDEWAYCPNCAAYVSMRTLDQDAQDDFNMGLGVEFCCPNCGEAIQPQDFFIHSNHKGG